METVSRRLLPALLSLSSLALMEPASAAAQDAPSYRVFIEAGNFTLNRNGSPCKFFDLTRINVSSFEVNSSFQSFETVWAPDYDVEECGFYLRPKLEMWAQWRPTPLLPPPGGAPPEDFIMVDFRLVLQIHECPGDSCEWFDTQVSIYVRTDYLLEAGTDLPGKRTAFSHNHEIHGNFAGSMELKVATERVNP